MVDIVYLALAASKAKDVSDGVQIIERAKSHLGFGQILIELPVDAVSADLAQSIAIRILEFFLEKFSSLFQLGRVAGPKALIDLEQSFFMGRSRILFQGIQNQVVL